MPLSLLCGFAAELPTGWRYRSITARLHGAQQQRRRSTASSSKCEQCHVDSWCRKLSSLCISRDRHSRVNKPIWTVTITLELNGSLFLTFVFRCRCCALRSQPFCSFSTAVSNVAWISQHKEICKSYTWGEVTPHNLCSRYGRHFVGRPLMTRNNLWS